MNQFMIGLVLVIIIIILVTLLGALNKMYPENFFGTCQNSSVGMCHRWKWGKSCNPYTMGCRSICAESNESGKCLRYETIGCVDCDFQKGCKCA